VTATRSTHDGYDGLSKPLLPTRRGGRHCFCLIDPCIERIGSHPFHYAHEVLAAAAGEGYWCTLVTHRSFAAHGDLPPDWQVLPLFADSGHSKYTAFGELDRLDFHGRQHVRLSLPWSAWHTQRRRAARIESFATTVRPVIENLQAGDVVLVATASELDAAGLARAIAVCRPPLGIDWHLQFHYPLYRGFANDFARQQRRLRRVQALFQQAVQMASPHVLHFHTTTEELTTQYDHLGAGHFSPLPYPAQLSLETQVVAPWDAPSPSQARLRVACLGDARPEKNSQSLPGIIATASRDRWLAGRLLFAVQSNLGFLSDSQTPAHRAVRESIRWLSEQTEQNVQLLGGPLNSDAYARQLARADVMLLPYDQNRYLTRCSGILLESLAAGAVPIVTGGGWMARQLAEPLRLHAEEILRRFQKVSLQAIQSPTISAARPLSIPLQLPHKDGKQIASHGAIVVDVRWPTTPLDGFCAPPLRLAVEGFSTRPPTVVSPDPLGRPVTVLFPFDLHETQTAGDHSMRAARLLCAPACKATNVFLAEIGVGLIACDDALPAAAVGVVIDSVGTDLPHDVTAALREVVRHLDHYRSGAHAHARRVRESASGKQVVRRLLS